MEYYRAVRDLILGQHPSADKLMVLVELCNSRWHKKLAPCMAKLINDEEKRFKGDYLIVAPKNRPAQSECFTNTILELGDPNFYTITNSIIDRVLETDKAYWIPISLPENFYQERHKRIEDVLV